MIKLKIYTHQYITKIENSRKQIDNKLEDILKITFPEIKGRLYQGITKTPSLAYSIPTFLGLNEINIKQASLEDKTKNPIYASITSGTLFGDKIDKKLERVFETLGLIECLDRRLTITLPYSELLKRKEEEFCIDSADKQTKELVEQLICETMIYRQKDKQKIYTPTKTVFKEIPHQGLGKYIEMNANRRAHKVGSEFYAIYLPEKKTIEISKSK
jgi:hypothetical protein